MKLKAVDPKEKPKLIALIVVAVIIFAFSGFQILTFNNQQGSLVTAAQAEVAKKAASEGTTAAPGTAANTPGSAAVPPAGSPLMVASLTAPKSSSNRAPGIAAPGAPNAPGIAGIPVISTQSAVAMAPPVRGKDPFLPTGRFAEKAKPTTATPTPLPSAKQPFHAPAFDGMPTLTETTPHAAPTMPPLLPAPVLLPPPSPPPYTVTGVVVADRDNPRATPIAVLRSGASETNTAVAKTAGAPLTMVAAATPADRRFVTIGDPVGNGFVVAEVRADGVVLRSGKRLVTLKIGMANGNLK